MDLEKFSEVTNENAPIIMAKLLNVLSSPVDIKEEEREIFERNIQNIINKLKLEIPNYMHPHLEYKILYLKKEKIVKRTILEKFQKIIYDVLLKNTKSELENEISRIFRQSGFELKLPVSNYILNYIYRNEYLDIYKNNNIVNTNNDLGEFNKNDFNKNILSLNNLKFLENFTFLLESDDITIILDFIINEENKNNFFVKNLDLFFLFLKASNNEIYQQMISTIHTKRQYFKPLIYSNIPDIDLEKIIEITRDYNFEVIASVLEKRPHISKNICKNFVDGILLIPKNSFIKKLIEYDKYFIKEVFNLELNSIEIKEICMGSEVLREEYFLNINDDEKMMEFSQFAAELSEEEILKLIKCEKKDVTLFIECLTKNMRFSGNLKEFLMENFAKKEQLFHCFMSYFSLEEIEELFIKYYKPVDSLESLFKKFHPQELLIEIHKFRKQTLTNDLIIDAINSSKYTDADFAFLLTSLEGMNVDGKLATCLEILRSKPLLRKQALLFFQRTYDERILKSKRLIHKFEQCVEIIGPDIIPILENWNKDRILSIFKTSYFTKDVVREYMYADMHPGLRWIRKFLGKRKY